MDTLTEILLKNGMSGKVFSTAAITNLVQGSAGRRWGLVHRALESGELVQLKRGLYAMNPNLANQDVSLFTIANRLVAESYVSMETALGFHGWLQEETVSVQSCVPTGRSRSFQNRFGEFVYRSMPMRGDSFFLGVQRQGSAENAFLIAGPERGLGDTVASRELGWEGINGLCARLRLDLGVMEDLDLALIRDLSQAYRSPAVRGFLGKLHKALGGER